VPRLNQVPASDNNPTIVTRMYKRLFGDRDPVAEPGTATGTPGDWWTVFANSEGIFEHAVAGFGLYQNSSITLDPILRELAQTRVGYLVGSQFVFSQHCKSLRGLGCSEERIEGVAHWPAATCYSEVERMVLGYADCLVSDLGRVPDGLFEGLRQHLSDVEMLELTYITSLYMKHAVMCKALKLEFDDVDERVVEIRLEGAEDRLLRIRDSDD